MLTPDQVVEMLQDRKLQTVADRTGLHYNTLKKLRDGNSPQPTYKTVKALSDYFLGVSIVTSRGLAGDEE